jgi:putative inorganic carbon (HCO3(-)) transporter
MHTKLLWLEPIWVLLLGLPLTLPGRFLPLDWHPYLLMLLFLFWPLWWIDEMQRRRYSFTIRNAFSIAPNLQSPLALPICALLCWLPINLWASVDRTMSWIAAGYLLFGLVLCLALIHWTPMRAQPERHAVLLAVLGCGLALISPPFVAWKPEFRLFHLPLYDYLHSIPINIDETIHANVLAGALVVVFPILALLTIHGKWTNQQWLPVFCGGLTFVILVILILTQSRGGYLAISCALFVIFLLHWPQLLYAVPLAMFAIFAAVRQVGLQTILNAFSADSALGGWDIRLNVWQQSYYALVDFAYTGIGLGTFTLVIPLLYPLLGNPEELPHAHNLFLQIGVDLGLPGLIAYLALLINLFVMVISVLRNQPRNSLYWTLAAGSLASLVAILTHGMLDAALWGTKLAFMPWLLYALITLLFLRTQNDKQGFV